MTAPAPKTSHPSKVPASAAGPNRVITPTTPNPMAPSWRGVNRSCPSATEKPSRAMGVRAELMTAARPAVMCFRP